jgi:hypothetical protein
VSDEQPAEGLAAYATAHDLAFHPRGGRGLGEGPPLLERGDRRRVEGRADGLLAPNLKGTLAHLTIGEVVKEGQYGNKRRRWTPYTVATTPAPRAQAFIPTLACRPRSGLRLLEGVEDALLHRGLVRVTLESVAFDERWELFVSEQHDENWVRQLFGPSFIVWLTEEPPEGFAFEYGGGVICANLEQHRTAFGELDALRSGLVGLTRAIREQIFEKLGRAKKS